MKHLLIPETQLMLFSKLQAQFKSYDFELKAWSEQQLNSLDYFQNSPSLALCFWEQTSSHWLKQIQARLPWLPIVVILNPEQTELFPEEIVPSEILFTPLNPKETSFKLNLLLKRNQTAETIPNQFPEMFQKHHAIMLLINPENGRIVDANLAASQFYGYPLQRLRQMKISDINTMDPHEIQLQLSKAAKEQGNSFEFEHRLANGELRSIEVHSTPMTIAGNKRLFSVISDISARRQAQQALLKSESRYREIVEASEQGICLIDHDDLILFANPKMLEILEIETQMQLIGCSFASFMIKEDQPQILELLECRPKKKEHSQEFKLQTTRGNQCWVSLFVTPLYDEYQVSNSSLLMVTNITEQKLWEQTTQKTLHERELLLQEIHHRVKNNFQLIISLLRMQVRKTEFPEVKASLKKSQNRIRTMALIHEQLYLSKNIAQVYFDEYLKILTRELHQAYRPESRACALRFKLESLHLELSQAIPCSLLVHELLSNAFKYAFTEQQIEPEVCICLYQEADRIYLEIHDNGIGFDYQADQKLNSLGLQLVRQLSEQVNGDLSCVNDQGTHWKISFDLERSKHTNLAH